MATFKTLGDKYDVTAESAEVRYDAVQREADFDTGWTACASG